MVRALAISLVLLFLSQWRQSIAADPKAEQTTQQQVKSVEVLGLDGKKHSLKELQGKNATVLAFLSFECPVSNSYLATLHEMSKKHAKQGVQYQLICPSDESVEAVKKLAEEYKLEIPVYLDTHRLLAKAVGATITPEVVVLDGKEIVQYRGRIDNAYSARLKKNANISSHDLSDALEDLLAGKSVRTPKTTAIGCPIDFDIAKSSPNEVTYYRDVAAILQSHCQICHRAGEVAPFALSNYRQAKRWAADIKEYTASHQMPPWMPAGGVAMKGERKMTPSEIATLAKWEEAGCPEGNPADAPPPAQFAEGWRMGPPDLIITPSEDFHLGGSGPDLFRCFVIPTGLTENRWVVGYDVKPGNPKIVHHTLHFFDGTGQGRELEKKQHLKESGTNLPDHGPGYPVAMGVGFVVPPGGRSDVPRFGGIGGWAPGQTPVSLPSGAGWLLPKGSDFIIQTHYHRDGKEGTDRPKVGLYFAKGPINQPWQTLTVDGMKPGEKIPAGQSDHHSQGAIYLKQDALLHNVLPHMHLLGKNVRVKMTQPGGEPVVLVDIPAWDYRWQETYWFAKPIAVKAGTKLEIEATFDNSSSNPNNPSSPPREVHVGEQTTDEMLFGFFGVTSLKTPFERVRTSGMPPADSSAVAAPIKGTLTPLLEQRLGNWKNVTTMKPLVGEMSEIQAKDQVAKAFNETFLRVQSIREADGSEVVQLITFDPEKKQYRMWTDSAQGSVASWVGIWDEKKNTLTWKANLQANLTGTMTWKFEGEDKLNIELSVKSGFAPVMTIKSAMTRQK